MHCIFQLNITEISSIRYISTQFLISVNRESLSPCSQTCVPASHQPALLQLILLLELSEIESWATSLWCRQSRKLRTVASGTFRLVPFFSLHHNITATGGDRHNQQTCVGRECIHAWIIAKKLDQTPGYDLLCRTWGRLFDAETWLVLRKAMTAFSTQVASKLVQKAARKGPVSSRRRPPTPPTFSQDGLMMAWSRSAPGSNRVLFTAWWRCTVLMGNAWKSRIKWLAAASKLNWSLGMGMEK